MSSGSTSSAGHPEAARSPAGSEDRPAGRQEGSQLLSVSAAARLLGVSSSSLRAWAAEGRVPHLRTPGGHRRFELDELVQWLAERGGAPPAPQQRLQELVPTRMDRMESAAEELTSLSKDVVAAFEEELSTGRSAGMRSPSARQGRVANAVEGLAEALERGDLAECYREAEWEGFRHGAQGQPGDAPVTEALALRRAVDRVLAEPFADRGAERRAIERALDRMAVRVAAGYADGVRCRLRVDAE